MNTASRGASQARAQVRRRRVHVQRRKERRPLKLRLRARDGYETVQKVVLLGPWRALQVKHLIISIDSVNSYRLLWYLMRLNGYLLEIGERRIANEERVIKDEPLGRILCV